MALLSPFLEPPIEVNPPKQGKNLVPLIPAVPQVPYQPLQWMNGPIYYPGMVKISINGDGSCLFNAIAYAFFTPYRLGHIDGVYFDRESFIKNLRKDLANILESKDSDGIMIYDKLSRGKLREFSEGYPDYKLENMMKELRSKRAVDSIYFELISNFFKLDIYILDQGRHDVYQLGDVDLYYKERPSIVLLYNENHYDLVGLETSEGLKTRFDSDHPFIRTIYNRIVQS